MEGQSNEFTETQNNHRLTYISCKEKRNERNKMLNYYRDAQTDYKDARNDKYIQRDRKRLPLHCFVSLSVWVLWSFVEGLYVCAQRPIVLIIILVIRPSWTPQQDFYFFKLYCTTGWLETGWISINVTRWSWFHQTDPQLNNFYHLKVLGWCYNLNLYGSKEVP